MALWLLFLWFWRAYLELGAQSSTLEFQAAALSYRYPALSGTVYFSGLRCFPNSFAPESAPWLPCSRRAPALWGARHEGELGFTWQGVWAAHCLRKHERQAASGTWSSRTPWNTRQSPEIPSNRPSSGKSGWQQPPPPAPGLILPFSEPRSLWAPPHPALPRDLHALLQHTKATQHTWLAASVDSRLPSWEAPHSTHPQASAPPSVITDVEKRTFPNEAA